MKNNRKGFTLSELVVVFTIVLIAGALMVPIIRYSRQRMGRIMCANRLQEQALALYIYAKEHGGKFPPSLKALYDDQYLADKRLMDCPASKNTGTPDSPGYIYTAGLKVKDPSKSVLVQDKSENHSDNGKNVLYVNGDVLWKEW